MRSSRYWLGLFVVIFGSTASAAWNGAIIEVSSKRQLTPEALYEALSTMENIALGEKHYTPAIQQAQARVIRGVVGAARAEGRFTVGWEFLVRSKQEENRRLFEDYVTGKITAQQFLTATQGKDQGLSYAPILEAVRDGRGELIGVNLSRAEKRPAVQGGLEAMDPKLVPPDFRLGGDAYYERFVAALGGGHGLNVKNYFIAQCLTDAWLAHGLLSDAKHELRFLVAGAFHTDYRDGAVAELYSRGKKAFTRSLSFIDAADYTAAELKSALTHSKYGIIADYAVVIGEPSP